MRQSRVTLPLLQEMHRRNEKIAMLTCYDASFAALLDSAGIDVLLIGDSLGMVIQGQESTLAVTMEDMVYHTACVKRGAKTPFIITDMPFGSYQESKEQAYRNAARLVAAGAQMVKLEGGAEFAETISFLSRRSIPVCGHLGLTPQSIHQLGGYKVQGKSEPAARKLIEDAIEIQDAGVSLIVLEAIPALLAQELTQAVTIPTIGIGAGADCSGQVLVLYDMLGIYPGKPMRFVKNFMEQSESVQQAIESYISAVKDGSFPRPEHSF